MSLKPVDEYLFEQFQFKSISEVRAFVLAAGIPKLTLLEAGSVRDQCVHLVRHCETLGWQPDGKHALELLADGFSMLGNTALRGPALEAIARTLERMKRRPVRDFFRHLDASGAVAIAILLAMVGATIWWELRYHLPAGALECERAASAKSPDAPALCLALAHEGWEQRRAAAAGLLRASLLDSSATSKDLTPLFSWVRSLDPELALPAWVTHQEMRAAFRAAKPYPVEKWEDMVVVWGTGDDAAALAKELKSAGAHVTVVDGSFPGSGNGPVPLTWAIAASSGATAVVREVAPNQWELGAASTTLHRVTGTPLELGQWFSPPDQPTKALSYVKAAVLMREAERKLRELDYGRALNHLRAAEQACGHCELRSDVALAAYLAAVLFGDAETARLERAVIEDLKAAPGGVSAGLWASLLESVRLGSLKPWPPQELKEELPRLPAGPRRHLELVSAAAIAAARTRAVGLFSMAGKQRDVAEQHSSTSMSSGPGMKSVTDWLREKDSKNPSLPTGPITMPTGKELPAAVSYAERSNNAELLLLLDAARAVTGSKAEARPALIAALTQLERSPLPLVTPVATAILFPDAATRPEGLLTEAEWSSRFPAVLPAIEASVRSEAAAGATGRRIARMLGLLRLNFMSPFKEHQPFRKLVDHIASPAISRPGESLDPLDLVQGFMTLSPFLPMLLNDPSMLESATKWVDEVSGKLEQNSSTEFQYIAACLQIAASGVHLFQQRPAAGAQKAQRALTGLARIPSDGSAFDQVVRILPGYMRAVGLSLSDQHDGAREALKQAEKTLLAAVEGLRPSMTPQQLADVNALLKTLNKAALTGLDMRAARLSPGTAAMAIDEELAQLELASGSDGAIGRAVHLAHATLLDAGFLLGKKLVSPDSKLPAELLAKADAIVDRVVDTNLKTVPHGSVDWWLYHSLEVIQASVPLADANAKEPWLQLAGSLTSMLHEYVAKEPADSALIETLSGQGEASTRWLAAFTLIARGFDSSIARAASQGMPVTSSASRDPILRGALPAFDRALDAANREDELYVALSAAKAQLLEALGDDTPATVTWNRARTVAANTRLAPMNPLMVAKSAQVLADHGAATQARSALDDAMKSAPEWRVYLHLIAARVEDSRGDPAAALAELQAAREDYFKQTEPARTHANVRAEANRGDRRVLIELDFEPLLRVFDVSAGQWNVALAWATPVQRPFQPAVELWPAREGRVSMLFSLDLAIAARELMLGDERGADVALSRANVLVDGVSAKALSQEVSPRLLAHVVLLADLHGQIDHADGLRRVLRHREEKLEELATQTPWLLESVKAFDTDRRRIQQAVELAERPITPATDDFLLAAWRLRHRGGSEAHKELSALRAKAKSEAELAYVERLEAGLGAAPDDAKRNRAAQSLLKAGLVTSAIGVLRDIASPSALVDAAKLAEQSPWPLLRKSVADRTLLRLYDARLTTDLPVVLANASSGTLAETNPTLTAIGVWGAIADKKLDVASRELQRLVEIEQDDVRRTRFSCWLQAVEMARGSRGSQLDLLRAQVSRAPKLARFAEWLAGPDPRRTAAAMLELEQKVAELDARTLIAASSPPSDDRERAELWQKLADATPHADRRESRYVALVNAANAWGAVEGETEKMVAAARGAIEVLRQLDSERDVGSVLGGLAKMLHAHRDYERERQTLKELIGWHEANSGDDDNALATIARLQYQHGEAWWAEKNRAEALVWYRKAAANAHGANAEDDETVALVAAVDCLDGAARLEELSASIEKERLAGRARALPVRLRTLAKITASAEQQLTLVEESLSIATTEHMEDEEINGIDVWRALLARLKKPPAEPLEERLVVARKLGHRKVEQHVLGQLALVYLKTDRDKARNALLARRELNTADDDAGSQSWNLAQLTRLELADPRPDSGDRAASYLLQLLDLLRAKKAGEKVVSQVLDAVISDEVGTARWVLPHLVASNNAAPRDAYSVETWRAAAKLAGLLKQPLGEQVKLWQSTATAAAVSKETWEREVSAYVGVVAAALSSNEPPADAIALARKGLARAAEKGDEAAYADIHNVLRSLAAKLDRSTFELVLKEPQGQLPGSTVAAMSGYELAFLHGSRALFNPAPPNLVLQVFVAALQWISARDAAALRAAGKQLLSLLPRLTRSVDLGPVLTVAGEKRPQVKLLAELLGSQAPDRDEKIAEIVNVPQ